MGLTRYTVYGSLALLACIHPQMVQVIQTSMPCDTADRWSNENIRCCERGGEAEKMTCEAIFWLGCKEEEGMKRRGGRGGEEEEVRS